MKKFIAKLVLVICLSVTIFSGCALTEVNMSRYLGQTVARTISPSDRTVDYMINLEELLLAINSNNSGQTYMEQGMSAKKMFEQVASDAISRKIILDYIDEEIWLDTNGKTKDEFVKYEWRALESTYDYINEQVASHEKTVRSDWKKEQPDGGDSSEETNNTNSTYVYTEHESRFTFGYEIAWEYDVERDGNGDPILDGQGNPTYILDENGDKIVVPVYKYDDTGVSIGGVGRQEIHFKTKEPNWFEENEQFPGKSPKEVKAETADVDFFGEGAKMADDATILSNSLGAQPKATKENRDVFLEAKSRFYTQLKKDSELRGVKGLKNNELLVDIIDRVYKLQLQNEKIKYVQQKFEENELLSDGRLTRIRDEIFNTYRNLVKTEEEKYSSSIASVSKKARDAYLDKMADSQNSDPVYYHPVENAFFYVNHILLKFDDATQKELDDIKAGIPKQTHTQQQYDNALTEAYKQLRVAPRDANGMRDPKDEGKLPQTILNEIIDGVTGSSQERIDAFRDFMYMYNDDEGIMISTRQTAYAIPTEEYKSRDQMVKAFADTSRELYKDEYGNLGTPGDFAPKLVESPYGYHIIMYLGPVENISNNFDNIPAMIETLATTRVRADHNKTYLDVVYEKLQANGGDEYGAYLQDIVDRIMRDVTIKFYPDRYKKEVKKYS